MRKRKVPTAATANKVILNIFRAQMSTQTVLVDEKAGEACLQAVNRRQQLQDSEDSLGRRRGAEDAEWLSMARAEGTRQLWLATSLQERKL